MIIMEEVRRSRKESEGARSHYLIPIKSSLKGIFKGIVYRLPTPSYSFLLLLTSFIFLISCGTGDDDGSRLGEQIVGTWQRVDLQIEGDTDFEPEDFTYDKFIFSGDGSYNGMVRQGSFVLKSKYGSTIYEGTYKCDNSNLRLEYYDEGSLQKILAKVMSFTDTTLQLEYTVEDYGVTVKLWLNRLDTDGQPSSSVTSEE